MNSVQEKIKEANATAIGRIIEARPFLIDIRPAIDVIPNMKKNMILHAGPPIEWERMCIPQKNSVIGAALYEGLGRNAKEIEEMLKRGEILLSPCHHHKAVGSMTGITSASMWVFVIENEASGTVAYTNIYERPEMKRLSFGIYNEEIINFLKWHEEVLAPVLKAGLDISGKIDLKSVIAKALTMGDECHNRCFASSALFSVNFVPYLIKSKIEREKVHQVASFLGRSEQFFLHLVMGACKVMLEAARGIEYSTVVTAIARNGVEVGIRVSSLGDEWYTGPADVIRGAYFPGYSEKDANPDIGDSAITETAGIGGFSEAAAPAIIRAVGGTFQEAISRTREMYEITVGTNPSFQLPTLDFEGSPTGIDIIKVVERGILPLINTASVHREGGLIGAGIVRPPMKCFKDALRAFGKKYI